MINQEEFNALVSLLDDPDKEVYEHVKGKLKAFGPDIIPSLENIWEGSFDAQLQQRIETLIHSIQFDTLKLDIEDWANNNEEDLLQGFMLISKFQYPDLDELKVKRQIDKLKRDIWLELNYNLTAIEQVNVFNHIYYKDYGFGGNTSNIQDPQNCYLNTLLDTKKGNTLSLGILYMIVARELGMPVYGVNLPQHFILVYMKDFLDKLEGPDLRSSVLFYVNTFNKGMIFTRNEINLYLKKLELEPLSHFYLPCTNKAVIRELVLSLISSFDELGSVDKVAELKQIADILEG